MTTLSSEQLLVATQAFLQSMRRDWVKANPDVECPIKLLEEYSVTDRAALFRAIRAAVTAATPENLEKVKARQL